MAAFSTAIKQGLYSALPTDNTSLTTGRLYYATDTQQLFRDNGTTWDSWTFPTGGGGNSAPQGYLQGFEVDVLATGGTSITVQPGTCRSTANDYTMVKSTSTTVDMSTTGAGALDTGTIAASTWYYVWVIAKSSDGTTSAIASTSSSTPTMPAGYDKKRRVGCVRTNASTKLWAQQTIPGGGNRRHVKYTEDNNYSNTTFTILSDADVSTSTTWDDVDCSAVVPPTSRWADMKFVTTGFASSGSVFYREKLGVSTQATWVLSSSGTAGSNNANMVVPVSSSQIGQVTSVNANTEHFYAAVMGYVEDVTPAISGSSGA